MVRRRAGASAMGCLVTLLVVAVVVFVGWDFGELYYRNYAYQDAMKQAVRFAGRYDDVTIRRQLRAKADSLELPPTAKIVAVKRNLVRRTIAISAEYTDTLRGPAGKIKRAIRFAPHAEGRF